MSNAVEVIKNNSKIAIYIRVSTTRFSQKESLENQLSYFENHIRQIGAVIYDVYIDNGITGTSMAKRDGLKKLMKEAEKQKFDVVYVKSISRWARDTVDSINLVRKLKGLKINLKSITENYDAFSDTGEFLLTVHSAIAQQESEIASSRIKFSTQETSRKGIHHGTPPYGYKKINKRLVPHSLTATTVKEIFRLYLYGGWGTQKIANHLTAQHIPTPRAVLGAKNAGQTWYDSTIRLILTNPHYVGDLVQGRQTTDDNDKIFLQERGYKNRINLDSEHHIIVRNAHDSLISREEFKEVQSKLNHKAKKFFRGRGNKALFARLAFCADCGSGMVYKKDRNSYVCGTYQRNGSKKCSSHVIKHNILKTAVLSDVSELASSATNMKELLEVTLKRAGIQVNHLKEELNRVSQDIKNADKELTLLTLTLAKGQITPEIFKMTSDVIIEEQNLLKKRVGEINQLLHIEEDKEQDLTVFQLELERFVNMKLSDIEVLRHMLHKLINKIEVFSDSSLNIHYNFKKPILGGA
ncbi:hypothetical protein BK749_01595 [Bacillus thuringiensis serovar vazensis]|uniref:Recombinase family protein n=1 Tax=Bacillus thuringiensis serovar vazensis TaxID=180867 RepID=A0A243D2B1_BACTU|nr:recombinase family protein [Bacillus thuringiensis]EEM91479.1 Site-specific recombinase (Resolvase family) [Bacillus thuringiensis serovar pulsiensis BGSC 4CC1]OTY80057.1 hypothetical protein BK749_01595 [Bacillus thuringiensis serovar vazensis]